MPVEKIYHSIMAYDKATTAKLVRTEIDQGTETLTASTAITFNITFSGTGYTVDGRCYDANGNTVLYTVSNKTTTGFTVEANADCTFEWTAILRT